MCVVCNQIRSQYKQLIESHVVPPVTTLTHLSHCRYVSGNCQSSEKPVTTGRQKTTRRVHQTDVIITTFWDIVKCDNAEKRRSVTNANLQHAVTVDQEVARFDVSMQDAGWVQILQTWWDKHTNKQTKINQRFISVNIHHSEACGDDRRLTDDCFCVNDVWCF